MPYTQAIIPLRGWITDTVYSGVPDGFTHDILNMIPNDPFRRRVRLGMRPGFNRMYKFASGRVQGLVRTNAFNGTTTPVAKDRVFIVNNGRIWYIEWGADPTQVPGPGGVLTAVFRTDVRVEGVQRGQYCYFVDGRQYVKVDLFADPPTWSYWHHGSAGPEDHVLNTVGGTTYTATLIALFGTRLVLAGVTLKENIWWMCAIDDPDAWSATTGNADGAIAGNDGQWGVPGDEIVALIPFGQGALIFAGKKSMSMLTSDPIFGNATIQQMSRTVGIVGPRAWCNGPEKTVYALGQDGLYRLTPNDFNIDRGQLLSLNKLDSFFNAVKWEDVDATLSYDVERRGVWMFLTRKDQPENSTHIFYSEQVDGFFPFRLYDPNFLGAYSTCQMLTSDGRNQVALFGSLNGQLGVFDQKIISGIDGYVASGYSSARNPTTQQAIAQRIPCRATIGPMVSTQPGLVFCNEVQIELGADEYLPDEAVKGNTPNPTASLLSAETAQEAIAESINSVLVSNVLTITANGGTASLAGDPQTVTYDGGSASLAGDPQNTYLDGQYSEDPAGTYTTQDTFVTPLSRVYENSSSTYELVRDTVGGANRWVIRFQNGMRPVFVQQQVNGAYAEDPSIGEYRYVVTDEGGTIVSTLSTVTASIDATTFAGVTVTEFGNLTEGANNRMRCRVRDNAMFLRLESNGYPFCIERAAINLQPVGPRRAVIDV